MHGLDRTRHDARGLELRHQLTHHRVAGHRLFGLLLCPRARSGLAQGRAVDRHAVHQIERDRRTMLRTPAKPISAIARDTVEMVPPPACLNDTLFTRRSSLCVNATSFRISAARLLRLSLSEAATRWMLATASDSAGKSLLWRMPSARP